VVVEIHSSVESKVLSDETGVFDILLGREPFLDLGRCLACDITF
jgi:hypothetical protein